MPDQYAERMSQARFRYLSFRDDLDSWSMSDLAYWRLLNLGRICSLNNFRMAGAFF